MLALQRAIGNQAVQGLMQQAKSDGAAGTAMRLPALQLQRACACGGESSEGECDECRLSRQASGESPGTAQAPGAVGEVMHSTGRPLDPATRTSMDSRFRFDFSRVRIHDDAQAAASTSAVSALAYTVGHHVVFGPGQYSPTTAAGRRLLAHELTHVVQQSAAGSTTAQRFTIGPANSPAEREAEEVAEAVAADAAMSSITETPTSPLQCKRLEGTRDKENMLNLGSAISLACCDTNACVNDAGGFDCDGFDCPKETGDSEAKNNSTKNPKHKWSPRLKCESPTCDNFKPGYTGNEKVVAMPKGRRKKGKDQCGQTLGLCAKGKSVEVTIQEFSNRNAWEASPGVWAEFGVDPQGKGKPDLFVSI
ncbi:MAG: DUF4157 domain-containing protein, partial [bacterium]